MPKWIMAIILGFLGLTVICSLILAAVPEVGSAIVAYVDWCTDTGASCVRNRQPGDQPGLC
jgi:hypothetical protein